jgi:hypothetical protein
MGLGHVRKVYEQVGREEPFCAVPTRHGFRSGRLDPDGL